MTKSEQVNKIRQAKRSAWGMKPCGPNKTMRGKSFHIRLCFTIQIHIALICQINCQPNEPQPTVATEWPITSNSSLMNIKQNFYTSLHISFIFVSHNQDLVIYKAIFNAHIFSPLQPFLWLLWILLALCLRLLFRCGEFSPAKLTQIASVNLAENSVNLC